MRYICVHISRPSRCIPWAYSKKKRGGGRGEGEKERGAEGKQRGDKGELSWENGGATRLAAILFRVAKTGFRSSCILLVILASCFLVRVIVNRENLYFLPPNKFHDTVRDIYIYNGFWYLDEGFFFFRLGWVRFEQAFALYRGFC